MLQIVVVTFIIMFLSISTVMFSQPPAPPDQHGINGNQGPGGPAAIDGGSLFLLVSAGSYGIYKLVRSRRLKNED
jgi:hypothetical protein